MKNFSITQRIFLPILILLLSSCGGGSNSRNPNVQVNELSNSTRSYDETIHINNCGGKAESEQVKERSFSTTIEGGLEVGVLKVVEGIVSAKYSQSQNTLVSQKLVAPAGTDMEFVLRWNEEVHVGNVTADGKTGTYTVKIPIAVEQVSSQDLGCSGNAPIPSSSTSIPEKSTYTVMLPANAPWFNTGITISAGQRLSISASGRVIMTSVNETKFSPNGQDEFGNPPEICKAFNNSPCLVDGAPYVFLVAKIDESDPFQVGSNFNDVIHTTGTIFLALNDNIDYYIDNHGEVEVKLSIK